MIFSPGRAPSRMCSLSLSSAVTAWRVSRCAGDPPTRAVRALPRFASCRGRLLCTIGHVERRDDRRRIVEGARPPARAAYRARPIACAPPAGALAARVKTPGLGHPSSPIASPIRPLAVAATDDGRGHHAGRSVNAPRLRTAPIRGRLSLRTGRPRPTR
jgi:hypothetical protein